MRVFLVKLDYYFNKEFNMGPNTKSLTIKFKSSDHHFTAVQKLLKVLRHHYSAEFRGDILSRVCVNSVTVK